MYSLVNAPVVARDLARHPRGGAVARDLLHVLALDDAALTELDRTPLPARVDRRRTGHLREHAADEPRALPVLAATRAAAAASGLDAWAEALPVLAAAPLGGRTELVRWMRTELLAAVWDGTGELAVLRLPRALDVVVGGVLATYAGDAGDPVAAHWRRWTRGAAPAAVTDPAVAQVVAGVAAARPDALAAAGLAMRRSRAAGFSWPHAVHDACWAVELTGRSRDATVAQLAAVAALVDVTGPAPAFDTVSAVTAAVHGAVVADVLEAGTVAAMCGPLLTQLS